MNVMELIPLISYQRVRVPQTSDEKWKQRCTPVQEQSLLSIAFRHDFSDHSGGWALGCAVIHYYRDFCGGLMVESGRVDLDMSPTHAYTSHLILGGREPIDVEALPHINELVINPPENREQLRILLEKSVAGAVASMSLGTSRAMIHFMDKTTGGLTNIMKHLKDVDTLTDVPHLCVKTSGGGRIEPFIREERKAENERNKAERISVPRPGQVTRVSSNSLLDAARATQFDELTGQFYQALADESGLPRPATLPVNQPVTKFTESMVEFTEVQVSWTESDEFINHNSGNTVYGAIINLQRSARAEGGVSAFCESCDDTFEYDGFTDCPDCGDEIFDGELTGRTSKGRPVSVVAAIRDKFGKSGAWKFMPHSMWRCG
jgi:hypothetical protein